MRLLLYRIVAVSIAALVLAESSGAARAFGDGATVSCCCGAHSAARKCRCAACPVSARRARRVASGDRLAAARQCSSDRDDAQVLSVNSLPIAAPFAVEKPFAIGMLVAPIIEPLHGRLLETGRPPP